MNIFVVKADKKAIVDCADELGIPGVRDFLDRMIVIDYIIANEDTGV